MAAKPARRGFEALATPPAVNPFAEPEPPLVTLKTTDHRGGLRGGEIRLVALRDIHPSPLNPRRTIDEAKVAELAASIAAQGLLQNLVLRPGPPEIGGYDIIAGERRYRALQLLAKDGRWDRNAANVPAKLLNLTDGEHIALALLENLQREDVNPMEEAEAFVQLQACDRQLWTPKEIAARIGRTDRFVQQRLALVNKLAPKAQQSLRDGTLTFAQARALTMVPHDQQLSWLKRATLPPGAELAKELTRQLPKLEDAIFPVGNYRGALAENEHGAKFFGDRAEFLELQKAAAEDQVEILRDQFAWVEFQDSPYFNSYQFEPERAVDARRAGAVIQFEPYSGKVTVHQGLIRKPAPDEAALAVRDAKRQAEDAEIAAFSAQLKTALIEEEGALLRLWLYQELLSSSDYGGHIISPGYQNGVPAPVFDGVHESDALQRLGLIITVHTEPTVNGRYRCLHSISDRMAVWASLRDHHNPGYIVEYTLAQRLSIHHPLQPPLLERARAYGIPVPACLLPDQADIEDAIAATRPIACDDCGTDLETAHG